MLIATRPGPLQDSIRSYEHYRLVSPQAFSLLLIVDGNDAQYNIENLLYGLRNIKNNIKDKSKSRFRMSTTCREDNSDKDSFQRIWVFFFSMDIYVFNQRLMSIAQKLPLIRSTCWKTQNILFEVSSRVIFLN